ncbi:MAG: TolC family protein, partial [Bacteroides sp.]|nr:TolC family protein [Bacteroides sp.]
MKKNILLAACFLMPLTLTAQNDMQENERNITLTEAIALARTQSVDAAVALNELKTAYWEYRTFRADLLPEVNLTGTLPNYRKSYSTYQNSDGSYSFVRNNTLGLSGQLSIDQNLWFTGGKLSLTSSLDYLKQLGSDGNKQFMSVPLSLELTQPIFGVNSLKWNRRIEPVRYAEAKAKFISATEEVTMKTITYFFQLLLAKEGLATAQQNKTNADRLYEVAIAKRKMGQISENDLLQLKLNALQGKADVTEAESSLKARMFQLRSFLGVSEQETLNPVLPASVPDVNIEYDHVLNKALVRNSFAQNIRRRQLEADYAVASARGNLRSIDLFASVGYTGQNQEFSAAYKDLLDNQIVQVGVKIQILDWGKRRGKVLVANSNREEV